MSLWSPALGSSATPPGRPMTVGQWLALAEDEGGELVAGRLEEEEVPDAIHELAVTWLIGLLRGWLAGSGFVFGSELKLVISERQGRKADVVVWLPGREPPPRRGPMREPPDVVVEVVTPTPRDERRDRVDKMADYAELGATAYWLVDPALGSFEVFELDDAGRYVRTVGATAGCVEIPDIPGLAVDLDALWAELDRLGPEPEPERD